MRRRIPAVMVPLAVAGAAACSHQPSNETTSQAHFAYTCCEQSDIAPVRHPGQAVTLHWIVRAAGETDSESSPLPVTLSAALTGPFVDVASLKASEPDSPVASSAPLHTTDVEGGDPTTTLRIPPDAKPGFYNLTFAVESGGGTVSGASVIRVQAAAG